jgi:lycopene beta-cyclase
VKVLIVGGGLAGGLIALALARQGRGAEVTLIEGEPKLGGNHTWSFHDTDLDDDGRDLVAELVTHRWHRHEVRFPGYSRIIEAGYSSISSDHFARVLMHRLLGAGVRIHLGTRVASVGTSMVRLEDETFVRGGIVIDARGPKPGSDQGRVGFQKFVGLELDLTCDGPWTMPLMMDACVPQIDGYRFTYVLPFTRRRVLIEDTVYSDNASINSTEYARGLLSYAAKNGAEVGRVLRREVGVLPLPIRAPHHSSRAESPGHAIGVGYQGGFFHAVTGYSLPFAVRVALAVARARTPEEAGEAVASIARTIEPQHRFGRLLNRLMFGAMSPASRWRAFERFYRLPEATIARFYAGQSTWRDRARVLVGRPPAGISWSRLFGDRAVHPSLRNES